MKIQTTLAYTVLGVCMLLAPISFVSARTLVSGTTGADVLSVQKNLIAKGYLAAGKSTGTFGSLTLAAVKKFQCEKKITCSGPSYGIVGPKTQAALSSVASGVPSPTPAPSQTPSPTTGGTSSTGLEVGGWIPYWRTATGTKDVLPHLADMTHVNPFVYTLRNNGTLYDSGKLTEEPWLSFIAEAKRNKVRVIPTLMSGSGEFIHTMLSNQSSRAALEDEIVATVNANNYDGIDIDFEGKFAETRPFFALFLKELYAKMGKKFVYCSIEARTPLDSRYTSTPPEGAGDYANDFEAINAYCDRVQIMAYDQGAIDLKLNRSRAAPYIPVSDPAWIEKVIELTAQTISKKKIILGIATYGYEYSVTPLTEYGYRYDREWAFNPRYATQLAAKLGITPIRNSSGELSFIYKPTVESDAVTPESTSATTAPTNTTDIPSTVYSQASIASQFPPPFNILWWSDAQAIKDKVALAQRLGLRGVSLFKLDGGQDPMMWSVLPKGAK